MVVMPSPSLCEGRPVDARTAYVAVQDTLGGARETRLGIGSRAKPARGLEVGPNMRAKVAEMHTAGDWSTNKIFGMKRKTVPFGSIASFSMKESNKPSIWKLSEVSQDVSPDR